MFGIRQLWHKTRERPFLVLGIGNWGGEHQPLGSSEGAGFVKFH